MQITVEQPQIISGLNQALLNELRSRSVDESGEAGSTFHTGHMVLRVSADANHITD